MLAALAALSLATPAMAQRTYDAYPLGGRPAEAEAPAQRQAPPEAQASVTAQSSYRDGPTQSQITFALQAQREAVRMCRRGNMNDELNRALISGGEQVIGSLISRAVNGRGYGYYGGGRNYGYSQSGQDCDELGRQVYQDALRAQPDSYCDSSMVATYTRGGQPATEERMVRRCQARTPDATWDQGFRPRN